jgi:hypothetical protein
MARMTRIKTKTNQGTMMKAKSKRAAKPRRLWLETLTRPVLELRPVRGTEDLPARSAQAGGRRKTEDGAALRIVRQAADWPSYLMRGETCLAWLWGQRGVRAAQAWLKSEGQGNERQGNGRTKNGKQSKAAR